MDLYFIHKKTECLLKLIAMPNQYFWRFVKIDNQLKPKLRKKSPNSAQLESDTVLCSPHNVQPFNGWLTIDEIKPDMSEVWARFATTQQEAK